MMNIVDIILLFTIFISVLFGLRSGFILGTLNLVTWVGSMLLGFLYYPYLGRFLQNYWPHLGAWTLPVAFLVTIVLARIIISLFVNLLLRITPHEVHHHSINKFFGMIPGFINGLINAVVVAALLLALPLFPSLSAATRDSKLADVFVQPAQWAEASISPVFNDAVKRSMSTTTIEPKSNETVKLPFTVTNPKTRPDLEAKMLQLVNEERRKKGLHDLKPDPQMTLVARAHAKDMFAKGYFAHISLDGKNPFDRMKQRGITFITAGENLALAPTLPMAHRGLMNSPGHRANILHPAFGRLGIGILESPVHGLMIAQEFRN